MAAVRAKTSTPLILIAIGAFFLLAGWVLTESQLHDRSVLDYSQDRPIAQSGRLKFRGGRRGGGRGAQRFGDRLRIPLFILGGVFTLSGIAVTFRKAPDAIL